MFSDLRVVLFVSRDAKDCVRFQFSHGYFLPISDISLYRGCFLLRFYCAIFTFSVRSAYIYHVMAKALVEIVRIYLGEMMV